MLTWLRKKPSTFKLKEVQIGDGNLTLDLASYFQIESEENNTTVVYDPSFTDAIARFSTLYISDEHNPAAKELAIDRVTQSAREKGYKLKKFADKRFYTHTEPSQQDDEPAIVHYWMVGFNNAVVIISCWIGQAAQNQQQSQNLLNAIEPAIQSMRLSKVQQYKLEEKFHHEEYCRFRPSIQMTLNAGDKRFTRLPKHFRKAIGSWAQRVIWQPFKRF